jgi:hypothetical protein|tara:strand:+ start:211 stop:423 length:213 start_codon:yes stop_codon:yes gene_type:complete
MKKITLNVDGITQKQWTNFVLELNIMKKAWRSYGVDVKMLGPGIKKIVEWGNKTGDITKYRVLKDDKELR